MQLTRKRTERSLERVLTQALPDLRGARSGEGRRDRVPGAATGRAERGGAQREASEFQVRAHPEIVRLLTGELHGVLDELRERLGLDVRVFEAPSFHPARFDVSS